MNKIYLAVLELAQCTPRKDNFTLYLTLDKHKAKNVFGNPSETRVYPLDLMPNIKEVVDYYHTIDESISVFFTVVTTLSEDNNDYSHASITNNTGHNHYSGYLNFERVEFLR